MSLAPVTVFESFSQTYTNGWNVSETGHQWLNPAGTNSNDGRLDAAAGEGTITLAGGDTSAFKSSVYVNVTNASNAGILVKMKSSGTGLAGPMLRMLNAGDDYYCVRMDTADRFNICISIAGVLTELNNVTPSIATNTYYWIRFESTSTNLRARIWAEGSAEPGTWDIDIAESGAGGAPDTGDAGMFYQGASSATTITIDSFYYYTGAAPSQSSVEPAAPVKDSFTTATSAGFGMSTSGHLWYGALADDPQAYAAANRELGSVASGIGSVALSTQEEIYGMIGPSMTTVMVEARFRFSGSSSNAYLGFRGTMDFASGLAEVTDGYAVRVGESLSTLKLYERNSSGAWTEIDSQTIGFTPTTSTWYRVRVLAVGSSIKATIWVDGTNEPSTWIINTTDATISSGSSFLMFDNATSSARTTDVDDFFSGIVEYGASDASAASDFTAAGKLTVVHVNTQSASGSISCNVPKPTGLAVNDLLVATVHSVNVMPTADTLTWIGLTTNQSGNEHLKVFYRVATSSDVSGSQYTFSCGNNIGAIVSAYRSVDPTYPLSTFGGQWNASSVNVTAPSITTTQVANLLVSSLTQQNTSGYTPPSGFIEPTNGNIAFHFGIYTIRTAYKIETGSIGSTGTTVGTLASAAVNVHQVTEFNLRFHLETGAASIDATGTMTAAGEPVLCIRPSSDITVGGWTPSSGGSLYATIDEIPFSDADYNTSPTDPISNTMEVKFGSGVAPGVYTGHVVRYRLAKTVDASQMDVTVSLYCNTTLIKSWTHTDISATATTYTQTLLTTEADDISDYTDLRLRITANEVY